MTDQDLSDEGFVGGFGRFRLIGGFHGYNKETDQYNAWFHHVTIYAKDDNVRNFLMVASGWPTGRFVLSHESEIYKKAVFSPN